MKKLFLVRHADDNGHDLTQRGRMKISHLGTLLSEKFNAEDTVSMLSSTAPRAVRTSGLLGPIFGKREADIEKHPVLWSGFDGPPEVPQNDDEVLRLIELASVSDIVVVVTHGEYSVSIPHSFGERVLHVGDPFPAVQLGKGDAYVIDCEGKTCERIVPQV